MLDPVERKMLYAFLSVLFRHPDEQTIAATADISDDTFQAIFPGLGRPAVPPLEELRADYRRLFLPPDGGAPPYGSAYLERPGSGGYSARLVANLYSSAGLNAETDEAPDYLPTELEFLYYLTEGEEQSLAAAIDVPAQRWVASQADFFHNFFAPWIAPFCARIAADAGAPLFYRWSVDLLQRFVDTERQRLKAV